MTADSGSKHLLECALRKMLSLTDGHVVTSGSPGARQSLSDEIHDAYIVAFGTARDMEPVHLAKCVEAFAPLAKNGDMAAKEYVDMRIDLELFLAQVTSMTFQELCAPKSSDKAPC